MANPGIILLSIFFLAWTSTITVSYPNGVRTKANNVYIGTVDGKSFFAQMAPQMTWQQAKESCAESAMSLATITTNEQRRLLSQAHNNVTFDGYFWTSGRDALAATQMVWDLSRETINKNVAFPYGFNSGMLSCLTFHSLSDTDYHFDAELCTNRFGAICEIKH